MGKIVIVDDEIESLEIHKGYLEEEHTVITFQYSTEALEEMARIKPDVILMDIEMPFLNGFEMLERLHDIKECAEIPILGVTGQSSKASVLNFLGKGGAGYLTKPVEKKVLQEKVRELIVQEEEKKIRKKILIVDDELESLYMFKNILEKKYNVMALNSGKMAIEYLQKFVPDLIILDYQMPLYSGKATYQVIKNMESQKEVPIMFLTGTQDKETLMECAALKPEGMVLKTAGRDALLEKVASLLG